MAKLLDLLQLAIMAIHDQGIKRFASVIQPAGRVSLQANESGIDYYQIAGRPSGSGRIESSNSGGQKDGRIKIRKEGKLHD